MVSHKRALDDSSSPQKAKKRKGQGGEKAKDTAKKQTQEHQPLTKPAASLLNADEIDFPRGGGSSLTALEVKAIRAEGAKEAEELFKENDNKQKRKPVKSSKSKVADGAAKGDKIRIEHLNYKRLDVGMKIMGQIVGILPLTLLISLPNQLLGHIPITNISPQFTKRLEQIDEDENMESSESESEGGDETSPKLGLPELSQMFSVGQYVRAAVTAVFQGGASDPSGLHKSRDEVAKLCKRVELSLAPNLVNEGVKVDDLKSGFTLTASVRSVEDHGYLLDLGVPNADGFLSFKDPEIENDKLSVGQLCNVTVTKLATNKRTCEVTTRATTFQTAVITEVSSVTSILPGAMVQGLVLDTGTDGINLQLLGFFDGTADRIHLRRNSPPVKVGQKVKGRVLYQYSKEPPRFAVALSEYLTDLTEKAVSSEGSGAAKPLKEMYPLGYVLESVKVMKVEPERGVYLEVAPGVEGFAHISHLSDDHLPSVSTSGPYKVNTYHRARVTGYHTFDGLLQLSLKPSIFEQKFLQLSDFKAGEVVKGTIKSVNDTALFVSLSGNIDGVVWPNHFADIRLKHPAKRFKIGNPIKTRVLAVDAERKRISLTAKKTLLDSDLPVLANLDDVKVGMITHAVVFRVTDKAVMVEFFNNLKAYIPLKEASDTPNVKLADTFPIGRVVKVRILTFDKSQNRISASIRQVVVSQAPVIISVDEVEIGDVVHGVVQEVHAENIVLSLNPSNVRALLSIKNLANHRKLSPAQIHQSVKAGEMLEELVVLTKNAEKGIVIVANKPKTRPSLPTKGQLSIDTVQAGQRVGGRVIRHTRQGTLIKITNNIGGILHPTDSADNYNIDKAFPAIDSLVTATIVSVEKDKRQLVLSTRASRASPDQEHNIADPEIATISDLHAGDAVRGFIKNIANHGLFVTIGRGVDARVQIRELFDEFVKEWKPRFKEHQLVKGRILSVDVENKQVEMTFKSGDLSRGKKLQTDSVKEGQKVSGVIKRVEPYGLFIDIKNSKLHGLCHKSQLSDNTDADVDEALRTFRVGDLVKAVVLHAEKGRISLSLKPSLFDDGDFEEKGDGSEDGSNDETGASVQSEGGDDGKSGDEDEPMRDYTVADSDEEDEDDEAMMIDMDQTSLGLPQATSKPPAVQSLASAPSLTLKGDFQWFDQKGIADNDGDTSSSGESDNEAGPSKRSKKKRKEIQQDLTADMHTKRPESNSDFERLLLGSPNSSYIWIQYMSFQLQISEIDKAREIAKRAVETINFREEQERLNVWIALLNLENVYGTEESLENVLKDAARANDSKTVHLRLAAIFDQSQKPEKAEQQFQRTCKKFGKSSKVWTLFGEFYLRQGKVEEARKLLPRSLQSLEKRKHLETISRFAQLEYKLGDAERGRTLFEGIIDSHPKRWDLWSVYMDMEGVQQNIQAIRNLFDRVLSLKMTSHKAKSFFKKWLDLEKRLGDNEGVENVKKKAVEWTQNAAPALSSS